LHQVEILSTGQRRAPIAVVLDSVSDHPATNGQEERESLVGQPEEGQEGDEGCEKGGMLRKANGTKTLPGDMHEIKVEELEGQVVKISISHDGHYATAVAIAPEMPELESVAADVSAPASVPSLLEEHDRST